MNKFARVAIAVLALSLLSTAGISQKKKSAPPTCPVCKMALSAKKTKSDTIPVKIKGKTWYCCSACKMDTKKKK